MGRACASRPKSAHGKSAHGIGAALMLLVVTVSMIGCGTLTSTGRVVATSDAAWALLPIDNLSNTPLAGQMAGGLVETRLRARGVSRVANVTPESRGTLVDLLDGGASREELLRRARIERARYALGGTVHEWHYKGVPDREPVIGLSLTLIEVASGQVLWQGSAARSGWGNASLSALASEVIADLLAEISLRPADAAV